MTKQDLPLYHPALGYALRVVAEIPDTDVGTKLANAYMEANPGVGVLEVVDGRVILAHNDDKGLPVGGPVRRLRCTCCGAATTGRQWHNQDTGYGLCVDCIDFCGRHLTADEFQRTYGLCGIHYDLRIAKHQ